MKFFLKEYGKSPKIIVVSVGVPLRVPEESLSIIPQPVTRGKLTGSLRSLLERSTRDYDKK